MGGISVCKKIRMSRRRAHADADLYRNQNIVLLQTIEELERKDATKFNNEIRALKELQKIAGVRDRPKRQRRFDSGEIVHTRFGDRGIGAGDTANAAANKVIAREGPFKSVVYFHSADEQTFSEVYVNAICDKAGKITCEIETDTVRKSISGHLKYMGMNIHDCFLYMIIMDDDSNIYILQLTSVGDQAAKLYEKLFDHLRHNTAYESASLSQNHRSIQNTSFSPDHRVRNPPPGGSLLAPAQLGRDLLAQLRF